MDPLLSRKVVLVTGSAHEGSIGAAVAEAVLRHGGTPVVTSRDGSAARAAARRLSPEERAAWVALDVTDEASVARAARAVLEAHGRVDGVVHNAGYPLTQFARRFEEVDAAEYARVFDVDVVGALRLTKALLPAMRRQGGGSVVFTSSAAALQGYRYLHEFAPSKAGVVGAARSLAVEQGAHGVRSNAVAYGNIRTPATWDALDATQREALARESALARWGEPGEAADAVVFLLSDLASFVNGQVLVVDGGPAPR